MQIGGRPRKLIKAPRRVRGLRPAHRVTFATYVLVTLIVMLVFIIIDLDRPRRGFIEVPQVSLQALQRSVAAPAMP